MVKGASTKISVSSVTWNEAKTEAKLTLASKISEGKYTVNVSGVAEKALTGSVTTEAEKVAKVEVNSDVAVINSTNLTVGYTVYNQYGEDITATAKGGLTASATNGTSTTATTIDVTTTTGVAVINNTTSPLTEGKNLTLTIVDANTGVVASKALTVSAAASIAELSFGKIYNEDGLELSMDNSTENFYVEINAKDQYGNALKKAAFTASTVVLTNSNSSVLTTSVGAIQDLDINGDGKTELVVKVTPVSEGTATLNLVSLYNGKSTSTTLNVAKSTAVDSISLSAPELAVAGETVAIPYSALTNTGVDAKTAALLNAGVTVTASPGTGITTAGISNPTFKKNAATGEVELLLDLSTITAGKGKVTLVATTATGKVATLTVDVKEAAKPIAITGLKNITLNQVATNTVDISYKNLAFIDQYERTLTNAQVAAFLDSGYKVDVSVANNSVVDFDSSSLTSTIDYAAGSPATVTNATLNALAKGTATVKFELYNQTTSAVVADSAFETSVRVAQQSEFVSYEVANVETVYNDTASGTYKEDLVVYGVLSNGTKVVLPTSAYNVVLNNSHVTASAVSADNKYEIDAVTDLGFATGETEKTVKATVTIGNTGETLTKEIKVSNVAPKVASIAFNSSVVKGAYDLTSTTALPLATIVGLIDNDASVDTYGEAVAFSVVSGAAVATYATTGTTPVYITVSDVVDADKGATTTLTVTGNGTSSAAVSGIGASEADSFRVTVKADSASASFSALK